MEDNHRQLKEQQNGERKNFEKKTWNNNRNYNESLDPQTVQMMIYQAEMYILLKYPHLIDINNKHLGATEKISENSQFFVVKSFSEEDMHKAVKYNVWTSTKTGNQTLNNAHQIATEKGGEIYLFFSGNRSGRFLGVAKMKEEVQLDKYFPFWTQDNRWGGLFEIEWVFIKDVPVKMFGGIEIIMRDGTVKPVTFSRDAQEVPFKEGKMMLEIFEEFSNSHTILEHFEYYDQRQENYEKNLQNQSLYQGRSHANN